jgi:NAD-dependent dihydropyrimidine dehydrogenase PreA subunit
MANEKSAKWMGIDRDEIDWFPTIDHAKCVGCLACVKKCSKGVYAIAKGKPKVVKPKNCVVGCTGCDPVCPVGAISHPPRAYLEGLAKRKDFKAGCSCGGKCGG